MNSQNSRTPEEASSRNPAEYLVLGVLSLGSAHGYDVYRHLHDNLRTVWRLGRSQVYALLSKLEREGVVTYRRVEQETLPAKKIYSLNDAGREILHAWVSSPVPSVRSMRLEFLTKLYFARLLSPESEKQLLLSQLEVCSAKIPHLEQVRASARADIDREAVSFRMGVVNASIGWLQEILASAKSREHRDDDHC